MIELATRNPNSSGLSNTSFIEAPITKLPGAIVNDMALYIGYVAGASRIADYEEYLQRAGFRVCLYHKCLLNTGLLTAAGIFIVDTKADLNLYKESSRL